MNVWTPNKQVSPISSYGVYILQLIHFAKLCTNVDVLNNRNKFLTSKLLEQDCRYHKLGEVFS